jgi:transcriptional regulator with XRE-family HTH domain
MDKSQVRVFLYAYGKNFREMREKAKLTQLQVADAVRCSQAIISHIECGYMLPPPYIEEALIKFYDMRKEDEHNG